MDSDIGGILRILRKRDAQKNSLFCVHLQDTQIFLAGKNLRYEKNDTLSEPLCGEFVAFFSCLQQIFASLEYLSVRNRTQNKLFFCASLFKDTQKAPLQANPKRSIPNTIHFQEKSISSSLFRSQLHISVPELQLPVQLPVQQHFQDHPYPVSEYHHHLQSHQR